MGRKINLSSRQKIKLRIRKKVAGSAVRPRLVVFRSLNNIYAQLVDDTINKTLITVSSLSKEVKEGVKEKGTKTDKSKLVGKLIAQKALERNIKSVVFDRNGYLYHGRVKRVADSAKEAGLEF